jgi:hypothetical protein
MAFEVNPVPLSETIMPGLPLRSTSVVNSRATRRPDIDVSGIAARYSRVTSSTNEDAEASAAGELVVDEIQRPAGIGLCFDEDRGTRANSTTPGFPLAHGKTFLAPCPG